MANLSDEQKEFLAKLRITESKVLDATGMPTKKYKKIMLEKGYSVAIGVSPCTRKKHTLRSKSGHCLQCDSKGLVYANRHHISGVVYLAESKCEKLIKIGIADYPHERIKQLNYLEYAGVSDWTVTHYMKCDSVGRVEYDSHNALSSYRVKDKYYYKNGDEINSQEIFNCTLNEAKVVVEKSSGKLFLGADNAESNKIIQLKSSNELQPKCNKKTVAQFAAELGLPTALLLEQLKSSGVVKSTVEDKLEEADKTALLEYLRKEHGAESAPKSKITLIRAPSTVNEKFQPRNIYEVMEKISARRDRFNAVKANQSIDESNALRNHYFSMSKEQLVELWNEGSNDFDGDEWEIIRIALKNKG